jgi:hypothetical protein
VRRRSLLVGAASITLAAAVRLVLAPMRILSPDEAYYLCAARRGPTPWPIVDHPPLLGAYLALADRIVPCPIELRVRLVAIALQVVTALGVAQLAHALGELDDAGAARDRWALGAVLGTWGLLPMAGGLLATPDAPLLAPLSWLLALTCAPAVAPRLHTRACLLVLAALSVAAKASALPFVAVVAAAQVWRGDRGRGIALAIGALLATPLALPSLRAQSEHLLGRGGMVFAPHVGPLAAAGAFVVGQLLLLGPAVVVVWAMTSKRASSRALRIAPGLSLATAGVLVVALASALVSGRPPEPNWTAPAAVLVFAVTAVGIARMKRLARSVVLGVTIAPTVVALVLWSMRESPLPAHADPLARLPHSDATPSFTGAATDPEPRYARPSWRCVYKNDCAEIDAILGSSR